jgi:hypothetical protein
MKLELRKGCRIASESAALLILSLLACGPAPAAEQDQTTKSPVKLASRSLDATPAAFTVGSAVIVTRTDVESPLGRVRALDTDGNPKLLPLVEPDPAFKSVILTPSNSTGRDPSVVDIPDIPDTPGATTAPPRHPSETPNNGRKGPAPKASPNTRGGPTLASAPSKPEHPRIIEHQQQRAPATRFGNAEIGAVRAFTRF